MDGMTSMTRVVLSSLAALLFVYFSMPFFRALAIRYRIVDFPGKRKVHRVATPLLGGAAIYFGLIVGLSFNAPFSRDVLAIFTGATIIFFLGVVDDFKGLSARFRIAVQLIAALIVIMWGERISFLPPGLFNDILETAVSLVWVIGITNAINYLDGLDGLAAGSAVINLICFGGILYRTGQPVLFGVSFIMAAACLGFLPHNFAPQKKKVFLGDAGSTLIGFILASIGLCGYWAAGDPVRIAIPILILGVPIFDMIFTTIMRIAEGKIRTMYGWLKYAGKDHFHHYLVDLGLTSRGSVIFIYFTQIALGISAMIASVVGPITAFLSVFQGIMIFAIIGILIVMGKDGMRTNRRIRNYAALFCGFFVFPGVLSAEMKVIEGKNYIMEASPDFRTDFIMQENNNDLDTKNRDDRVQYIAVNYSLPFDLKFKEDGPEFFVQFQRDGVYDYDAPVVIHNTLNTFLGKFYGYQGAELLPKVKEYWADIPVLPAEDIRFKAGLFKYEVGHGISLNGSYQNYGLELYSNTDNFSWNFYTCWPDFANKQLLGPYIKQEKPQSVDYEHSKTYFLATDMKVSFGNFSVEPYAGVLMDFSEGKRLSYFQTPTRDDILGTVGISLDFTFDKLEISAEWARNFGRALTSQEEFESVVHQGYAVYADASYTIGTFVPRSRFVFASGNKLTTDMTGDATATGNTLYPGTKNNAFSVYSPFNGYLADSIYPATTVGPLVAMGNGYGMNYGVRRAGTFGDPAQIENLVLFNIGFEHKFIEKAVLSLDWWYMANAQKGIGMYNNIPKVISAELGNEVDFSFEYTATKNITLRIGSGIFLPGPAFREERDDVNGSLFTPFVRGDGKADPAYQLELSAELSF